MTMGRTGGSAGSPWYAGTAGRGYSSLRAPSNRAEYHPPREAVPQRELCARIVRQPDAEVGVDEACVPGAVEAAARRRAPVAVGDAEEAAGEADDARLLPRDQRRVRDDWC